MGIIKALKLGFDYQRYDDDGNVVDMQRAVNDVDLDIKAGEFVAVLGHNGSGKSTLAKHMNALLIPTEGTMRYSGRPHAPQKEKMHLHFCNLPYPGFSKQISSD